MVADTRAVMAAVMAEAVDMAEATASMARPSSFVRVPAAGGTHTANASAGGELGSIVAGSAGLENKIKGAPDNRLAFFLAYRLVLPDCFHSGSAAAAQLRTSLPAAGSA